MHEFSLAQGLHGQLLDLVKQHQADKVTRAAILIGSNAGVVEESFLFGVDILCRQDPRTAVMEVTITRDDGQDLMLRSKHKGSITGGLSKQVDVQQITGGNILQRCCLHDTYLFFVDRALFIQNLQLPPKRVRPQHGNHKLCMLLASGRKLDIFGKAAQIHGFQALFGITAPGQCCK